MNNDLRTKIIDRAWSFEDAKAAYREIVHLGQHGTWSATVPQWAADLSDAMYCSPSHHLVLRTALEKICNAFSAEISRLCADAIEQQLSSIPSTIHP